MISEGTTKRSGRGSAEGLAPLLAVANATRGCHSPNSFGTSALCSVQQLTSTQPFFMSENRLLTIERGTFDLALPF